MKTLVLLLLVVAIQVAVKPSEATWTSSRGLKQQCELLSLASGKRPNSRRPSLRSWHHWIPRHLRPVIHERFGILPYHQTRSRSRRSYPRRQGAQYIRHNKYKVRTKIRTLPLRSFKWTVSRGMETKGRQDITLWQRCCRQYPGLKGCAAETFPTSKPFPRWKLWANKPYPNWKAWTKYLTWKPFSKKPCSWTKKPFPTWKPLTRKPFPTWKPLTRKPFPTWKPLTRKPFPTWKPLTRKPFPTWKPWTKKPFPTWKPWTQNPFFSWKPWTQYPFRTWKPWTQYPFRTWKPLTQKPLLTLKPWTGSSEPTTFEKSQTSRFTTRLTTVSEEPTSAETRLTTVSEKPTTAKTRLTTASEESTSAEIRLKTVSEEPKSSETEKTTNSETSTGTPKTTTATPFLPVRPPS